MNTQLGAFCCSSLMDLSRLCEAGYYDSTNRIVSAGVRKRMFVIGVEGTIGAGKSTMCECLKHVFDITAKDPAFEFEGAVVVEEPLHEMTHGPDGRNLLAEFYEAKDNKATDPVTFTLKAVLFQTYVLHHRQSKINAVYLAQAERIRRGLRPYAIILDRTTLTDAVFGQSIGSEFNVYLSISNIVRSYSGHPDLFVHLNPPVKRVVSNVEQRARPEESTVKTDYLISVARDTASLLEHAKRTLKLPVITVESDMDKNNPMYKQTVIDPLIEKIFVCADARAK